MENDEIKVMEIFSDRITEELNLFNNSLQQLKKEKLQKKEIKEFKSLKDLEKFFPKFYIIFLNKIEEEGYVSINTLLWKLLDEFILYFYKNTKYRIGLVPDLDLERYYFHVTEFLCPKFTLLVEGKNIIEVFNQGLFELLTIYEKEL